MPWSYLFAYLRYFVVYEPKEDFLVNKLRTLPMFHDKEYAESHFAEDEEDFLVMPYVFNNISINLTKVRPLFMLSHRGSDNSPLLIVFSAKYIDQSIVILLLCN